MKLNTLEIKGFKSFGDKCTIHFDKGVTAIVGPNGSGKSNVVDAMRWVLGEQKTRMLRSEKMDNIIFNGTRTRNPANLAEVSLTFENTKNVLAVEYSTVTITRKLYRDGESEYYLNNVQCRLKDITDLFLDTGIGPDSYSIIELKMVDEILNDKHNTISQLLEEAAGVSKYKIRKKQTLAKLNETDNDLNRVNDLMFEIEKSLKQLEQQAKKTEKFERLKVEYKDFSIALSLFTIKNYKQTFVELQQNEATYQDEKTKLAAQIDTMEAALQQKKTDAIEKERSLSTSQRQFNEKIVEVNQAENSKNSIQDKLNNLVQRANVLQTQNREDESAILYLENEITSLHDKKIAADEKLITQQAELEKQKTTVDELRQQFAQAQEELKFLNEKIFKTRQDLNAHETRIAVNQAKFTSLNDELLRINQQNQLSLQKLTDVEGELTSQQSQKTTLEQKVIQLKEQKKNAEQQQKQRQDELKDLNTKLLDQSRAADKKQNEYNITKNLLEQMDGYPASIKYLKTQHEKSKRAPLLSDIISCKEQYKIAIENYLEPYLNYFVADHTNDAIEALTLLKESANGRAHFFVLDNFVNEAIVVPTCPAGCIRALDLVEFENKYENMFRYLLGHVFILEENVAIAQVENTAEKRVVFLLQNGSLVKQRYSYNGGSVGLFDGKRTGKLKNLQDMETLLQQMHASIDELQKEVRNKETAVSQTTNELREVSIALSEAEVDFSKVSATVTSLSNNKNFLQSGIESFAKTIEKLEGEIRLLTATDDGAENTNSYSDEIRKALNEMMDNQKLQQEKVNSLQHQSSEASQQYNQHNILCIQQQNLCENLGRDSEIKKNQLEGVTKRKENNTLEFNSTQELSLQLKSELEKHTNALVTLLTAKKEMEQGLGDQEHAYFSWKSSIDGEEKQVHDLRKQKEDKDNHLQLVHDKINELKLSLNSLKERLSLEFEANLNELLEMEPDEQLQELELIAKVEKLKKQITDFGPVNPMALEQFKEIKERHDFILKEQEDLRNAKISLLNTIAEIDQSAHEKFTEAFTKVRENFITVFRSLFREEDKCDLILTDPANPLESDVTIIAQPKGKKPLTIQQLSGGEKTLTATALLFGIYLLKPAPFCIFDEVDAPLDDNNIDKFINIIKKFSDDTQFIIITHNKKTMTATDVIYGITMIDQGITQVVPVDIREFEEV